MGWVAQAAGLHTGSICLVGSANVRNEIGKFKTAATNAMFVYIVFYMMLYSAEKNTCGKILLRSLMCSDNAEMSENIIIEHLPRFQSMQRYVHPTGGLTFVEVMILSTGGLSDMPVDIRALAVSLACIFPHGVSTFPSAVGKANIAAFTRTCCVTPKRSHFKERSAAVAAVHEEIRLVFVYLASCLTSCSLLGVQYEHIEQPSHSL